ncbi:MAG: TraB/GumN family protein [Gammaproteobacteria bacterium]|nr:TraB/GumN family protein [Gammaproteobacteria bacterium]MBT3860858.1 TraB/GumN family protein [Gammaproteobacteria bacterium]MBT3988381.1 TraB/GumN family protein [Gammaproteobacteria bacterium]MBT4255881.1 TraB/GumN family protein [Gammaproteobacteria bacterium]MBT4581440.1 TraB/GumN family protein [Gammaproteobacteria bacterium]
MNIKNLIQVVFINPLRNLTTQPGKVNQILFLLLLSSTLGLNNSVADTSVWEVSSGSNTVYLGGTVHLLRPSDYPLPAEYEQAYQDSSHLVFETDISSMNDLSIQASMLQQLTYSDGRTLKTVLSEEAYTALSDYVASSGMPMMMLDSFKPGLLISTLQVIEFQKMGFTPQGVDAYFNTRAIGDGKTLGQLETVQEQIGFLAEMGEGNESEFILMSLEDIDETDEMMEAMIEAWRSGDNRSLSDLFVADMQSEAPELYESLLINRNLRWIPQIEEMLRDRDTEFVLVGAAHLVGNQGLLELLSAKGYQIRQL